MYYGRIANKKLETEKNIFETAMGLFQTKGFTHTTMQDISKEAGVCKSTVFNYFPTKEDILLKFGKDHVNKLEEFVDTLPSDLNTKEKILAMLFNELSSVNKSIDNNSIQYKDIYKTDWIYTFEAQKRKNLAAVYQKVLSEAKEKKKISDCIDCEHIAGLIVAIYFYALYTGIDNASEMKIREYLSKSVELMWIGIEQC